MLQVDASPTATGHYFEYTDPQSAHMHSRDSREPYTAARRVATLDWLRGDRTHPPPPPLSETSPDARAHTSSCAPRSHTCHVPRPSTPSLHTRVTCGPLSQKPLRPSRTRSAVPSLTVSVCASSTACPSPPYYAMPLLPTHATPNE
eukprot:3422324-Prymnesium_polylepis.1